MPIDPRSVQWDSAPIDPGMVQWDEPSQPAAKIPVPQAQQPGVSNEMQLLMDINSGIQGAAANIGAGALRGAGSIGATLLAPYDMAKDAIAGKGLSLESNRERRAGIDSGLQELGADPSSFEYKLGKLGGEIAGTAGAGPLIASGAKAVPFVNTAAAPLISSIESGGLAVNGMQGLSGLAMRGLGGAITGGASAGLVNPEDAGFGAAVGSALPVGVKVLGTLGQAIGSQLKPSGEKAELARKAMDMGAPIGIADMADGKFTKAARSILNDSWLTGSIGSAQNEAKQRWLNRAVGEVFDASDDKLTPQVMDSAKKKMGAEFDRIWGNNNLVADNDFAMALDRLKANANMLPEGEGRRVLGMIGDLQSKVKVSPDGTSFIPGDVANRFQSSIRRTAESAQSFLKNDLGDLRQEIISAFNRSVAPEDAAALALNQSKYKAYKTVEPLLEKGALGVAGREAGDVPAALLPNAVFNSYKGNAANSPLADLSKIGSTFLVDRTLQTGGSSRAALQNTAIGAGLLGLGTVNPIAAMAVVPSAMVTNKALGSPALARGLLKAKAPQLGGLLTFGQKAAPILVTE